MRLKGSLTNLSRRSAINFVYTKCSNLDLLECEQTTQWEMEKKEGSLIQAAQDSETSSSWFRTLVSVTSRIRELRSLFQVDSESKLTAVVISCDSMFTALANLLAIIITSDS